MTSPRAMMQRRLLWALAASSLLHATLLALPPGAQRQQQAGGALLAARLLVPTPMPDEAATSAPTPPLVSRTPETAGAVSGETRPVANASPRTSAMPAADAISNEPRTQLPEARDPTIYSALQLDEYPRALTPLALRSLDGAPGKLRVTVLIDEAGLASDVSVTGNVPAELERAARELLHAARFSPARRDGRWVKARLVLEIALVSEAVAQR